MDDMQGRHFFNTATGYRWRVLADGRVQQWAYIFNQWVTDQDGHTEAQFVADPDVRELDAPAPGQIPDYNTDQAMRTTYWNERVGCVDPIREGQPLRWVLGPLKASSDPAQKWCYDCYGVVAEEGSRRWCRACKASETVTEQAGGSQVGNQHDS